MFKCPHCAKPTISIFDKCKLGTINYIVCESCKKRIGLNKNFAFILGAPIFIGLIICMNKGVNSITLLSALGMFALAFLIQLFLVPLEKK